MNNKAIKYPLILFIVTGFCAAIITLTYVITNPILEKRNQDNTKLNLEQLYNNTKTFKVIADKGQLNNPTLLNLYEVILNDNSKRLVYETTSKGKNGDIVSLIAFNKDNLEKIKNIQENETPGIGKKVNEASYLDSITKQDISNMNVDIIAGATYSSTALKNSVDNAIKDYQTRKGA
jgi:Na+-translocating ferredoxin:NAD+ oxidoreductase RnfG subunit